MDLQKEMNLGQITSLVHCKKCGMPIEIHPNQENVVCKNCNKVINLKCIFGLDLAKEL